MLEVEVDVFSGITNPTFALAGREEQDLVERIASAPEEMSSASDFEANLGLGYRGLIIRETKADAGPWSIATRPDGVLGRIGKEAIPIEFRLYHRGDEESVADWLLSVLERKRLAISDDIWEVIRQDARSVPPAREAEERPPEDDVGFAESEEVEVTPRGATWWSCNSALYLPNATLFNQPTYVTRNNCYCFGSNHLANVRFALPGRRGGRPATSITCGGVIDGLRADGWIDGCQINTLTIALVIWPNYDYHFYRVVTAGADWWWGHKPGGTPARYVDNSNRPLKQPLSPVNCNRGPYIHFCGYFYQNNSTALVA